MDNASQQGQGKPLMQLMQLFSFYDNLLKEFGTVVSPTEYQHCFLDLLNIKFVNLIHISHFLMVACYENLHFVCCIFFFNISCLDCSNMHVWS